MHYEGTVIRPPSESDSIILQVSVGCSHNRCTFCGAYKNTRFRLKDDLTINKDLTFASIYCSGQKRLFLADGDALIIPQKRLERIFEKINRNLPWVNRISLYANAKSIRQKSSSDLLRLKKLGLDRVYMGIESGDNNVLETIKKNETAESLEKAAKKIIDGGFFLSTSVILGLAEKIGSNCHAQLTAKLLNEIKPNQIAALTFIPLENTELGQKVLTKSFNLLSPMEILEELKMLIEFITIDKTQFMANHASNYLPLVGRLQKDKVRIVSDINSALSGNLPIKEAMYRTL